MGLQDSLYKQVSISYRAMFEDTASHRRQLKKMRSGNRRKMAAMKFQVEKSQQELMLQQQMGQFQ